MDVEKKMVELALSFPTLADADGLSPWNLDKFEQWAVGPEASHAAVHAASFVLAVWNSSTKWRTGFFNAVKALGTWDDKHRSAFLAWAKDPWFP